MARLRSIPASRNDSTRPFVLGIALAALVGWNAPDWIGPKAAGPMTLTGPAGFATGSAPASGTTHFPICGNGPRVTCVVDGDTFWLQGEKIRVADIDTPEISSPRCDAELRLGQRAKERMQQLLNAGPIALEPIDRATDRYGRSLLRVTRNGESLGGTLVGEGLAVWYGNGKPDWC
ncbi:endonuclease YncB(thermonuclease family) [Blastomonas natatoria]|uniref:Endonuclease YncB(Thermonuclease family) n=1 Tax=Blastomonas natatoria TaxID=34015 RepID=A0A2V3VRD7_9SPHN|nr:thermonuclease family protein [Blastomonas natatoria]PXW79089.1 endonuclease YncB(thermonuclease family) [Blastomonas natatoria]